jgi:TolA-binding protein
MALLCRWILVLTLLLVAGPRLSAASDADRAFEAAAKAFDDTSYDWAEAHFADFCRRFPASPRLAEAVLLQAEARIELTNYAGAIALLSTNQNLAGTNADQYLFWLAEAYSRQGDYRAASDKFAQLVKDFPASSRRLEAAVGEASARVALARAEPSEWPRVIQLLQQTNGVFQTAVRADSANELVPRGCLLLSEAQLAAKDYRAAEETLQPLAKRLLNPKLAWQWQYLRCRILLADGRLEAALQGATNLLAMATNAAQPSLRADSAAFQASLLERLGRTNEALLAYQQNLAEGVPAERQRQALLKIIELSLAQDQQDQLPQVIQMLEKFLSQYPKAAAADLALLTLGELRLRQYEAGADTNLFAMAATNAPPVTNSLQLALASLTALTKNFPRSPLIGKAQLDLGWCFWREGRLPEAQAAFQTAVECLPFSNDLATAFFRLADTQLQQTNFAGAIRNYQAIIERFAALPEVRTNLFERALSQTVWAGLAGNDPAAATNALQTMLAWYPNSPATARALLLAGGEISRGGNPARARAMFSAFVRSAPDPPLLPELWLAIAGTYEHENQWTNAIEQYNQFLARFPNSSARPQAEYYRADATYQAGQETNALMLFTAFIAHFPTNELAPRAQLWVADYYYRTGNPVEAERNYQLLYRNTNWPPSELTYQAQLSAGLAAEAHQGWNAAKGYFTALYNDTNCPTDLRVQALFEYGNTLMRVVDPADTNKLANCEEATRVFGRIWDDYPANRLAVPALIDKANCYMQWALARQQYDSLTNALDAYQQVVDSPQADVAARSQAKLGQAIVLGKWAEQQTGQQQTALLKQALSDCLDVFYGTSAILRHDHEKLVPFWTKEAGMRAFELAESLQDWSQAVSIYQRLKSTVWPQLPAYLEKRAQKALENLDREKSSR